MHRLAVAIMEPTGIDRRRNYGARLPGVALDASKCTSVLICIFRAETDEGRNVRNAINEAGRFEKIASERNGCTSKDRAWRISVADRVKEKAEEREKEK